MTSAELRQAVRTWGSRPEPPCVFIIGTGRSGTHLLADVLAASPDHRVLVEKQPLFRWSTAMAMDPREEQTLFPRWVRRMRLEQCAAWPKVVVDKSHPNIWITERLAAAFPRALFLGTRRSPHATVASMLDHGGFICSESRWRPLPLPNRLLGIDRDHAESYAALSSVEQLTLRWVANERRFTAVRAMLGGRLLEVEYEKMVTDTRSTLDRLAGFLGRPRLVAPRPIRSDTLGKWRQTLTPGQVTAIDAMLRRHGFAAACSRESG